ncbi:hypothetical protein BOTBODRAFT_182128 [Botryobasidium botryosum FD-172 SS1]|uniref:Uncharacterized protein n=1 Tax=Botryobasidium botryosum (strain FD-172 SS1) TaxID=930990 RepID=A0A067M2U5_BOTB1|nr:hypothetical protein BOTBODRAFT_182128 [Botryobasidium botryosum FD-172 SS1]
MPLRVGFPSESEERALRPVSATVDSHPTRAENPAEWTYAVVLYNATTGASASLLNQLRAATDALPFPNVVIAPALLSEDELSNNYMPVAAFPFCYVRGSVSVESFLFHMRSFWMCPGVSTAPIHFSKMSPNVLRDAKDPLFNRLLCQLVNTHLPPCSSMRSTNNIPSPFPRGQRSVVLPYFNPHLFFPPWILLFLSALRTLADKCGKWEEATRLLTHPNGFSHLRLLADVARARMLTLPWDSIVPGYSTFVDLKTSQLPDLLTVGLVTDSIMNAGGKYVQSHQHPSSHLLIFDTFLGSLLAL